MQVRHLDSNLKHGKASLYINGRLICYLSDLVMHPERDAEETLTIPVPIDSVREGVNIILIQGEMVVGEYKGSDGNPLPNIDDFEFHNVVLTIK
jgi:hypothetical protein